MNARACWILALTTLAVAAGAARADLYDIDFASPLHTVGFPPAVGSGDAVRRSVSELVIGTPTVVASLGALTSQPLQFTTNDGDADQIRLRLDDLPASDTYTLDCDLLVQSAGSTANFVVFLDTPVIRKISFRGNGQVYVQIGTGAESSYGTFSLGVVQHLHVNVNLAADTWTIELNGTRIYSSSFAGATAVNTVRFSTDTNTALLSLAAIDNVVISEYGGGTPCDRLTFGDLTLNANYAVGVNFLSEGVGMSVRARPTVIGNCMPPLGLGTVSVVQTGSACGQGKELRFQDAEVDIDFGGPVSEVLIPYGEYGGSVNLAIDGDCRTVANFVDLSGTFVGGTSVTVFDSGVSGNGCGVIRLGGTFETLTIGGNNLYIDGLSYCRACGSLARSAFDDLTPGSAYTQGGGFTSGAAQHRMKPWYIAGTTCLTEWTGGLAQISPTSLACGSGFELRMDKISDRIDFGVPVDWLAVSYGEYAGSVNINVNGDCANLTNLSGINGQTLGGAKVWAVDFATAGSGCGVLYATGNITQFGIGGDLLYIENVRACPSTSTDVTPLGDAKSVLELGQNSPNPMTRGTSIRFELPRAGVARLTVHDVGGRLVRTLVSAALPAGRSQVQWDGTDEHGRRLPAGLYSYRVEAAGASSARTLVLLPE